MKNRHLSYLLLVSSAGISITLYLAANHLWRSQGRLLDAIFAISVTIFTTSLLWKINSIIVTYELAEYEAVSRYVVGAKVVIIESKEVATIDEIVKHYYIVNNRAYQFKELNLIG